MDKIKHSFRTGSVDLKEVCQKWEEELFSLLIGDKEIYLPGNPIEFEHEANDDVRIITSKVYALEDLGIIDTSERDILVNKLYETANSYIKSKVKEVS